MNAGEKTDMSNTLDRREFIRRVLALSAAGAALSLAKCAPRPSDGEATSTSAQAASPTAARPQATEAPKATAASGQSEAAAQPTDALSQEQAPTSAPPSPVSGSAYLAVARGAGADPAELTRRAIAAVGGIERFVKPGARVIVKPNICNAYHGPEYASTTNPIVVATIVTLCKGAGATSVQVMDFPFGGTPQASYTKSGIEEAVKAAGGEMVVMSPIKYREIAIPQGKALKKGKFYGDMLDADAVINVPIAKHHSSAGLTLGMKNLMGTVLDRNGMHARGLHQTIADINSALRPQLTVVDAIRILTANGPTGGNLDDVKQMDTIIASADVVAADAYATTLFGKTAKDIAYIQMGAEMGLGQMDLGAIKIEEIAV